MRRFVVTSGAILGLMWSTSTSAQQPRRLDASELRALEAQVASAYAVATEADFIETRGFSWSPVTWRGHATLTKRGFVFDYAVPAGRRIVGDATTIRVLEPVGAPLRFESRVDRTASSAYAALMLLSAAAPAFQFGQLAGDYEVMSAFGWFCIDARTSHVVRIDHRPNWEIQFTNIHAASSVAIAVVQAALAP